MDRQIYVLKITAPYKKCPNPRPRSFRRFSETPEVSFKWGYPGSIQPWVRAGVYLEVGNPGRIIPPKTSYWRLLDETPDLPEVVTKR
jgi:hypothetical protein